MYSILVGYEKTHGERSMILCLQMFLKKIITKKRSINAFFGEWQIFILQRAIIKTVRNIKLYFFDGNYHCANCLKNVSNI